jgi:hypothetical protein
MPAATGARAARKPSVSLAERQPTCEDADDRRHEREGGKFGGAVEANILIFLMRC